MDASILTGVAPRIAPDTTSNVAAAFRGVFGGLACLSGLAALLAWSIPAVELSDPAPASGATR